jgi:hypothetical protein
MLEVNGNGLDADAWHARITQEHFAIHGERPYRISLWARTDRAGARISVGLRQSQPPYRVLASVPAEWRPMERWTRYIARVSAAGTEPDAAVAIMVGHGAGTVWITDVSLREDPASGLLTGESPAGGTVPPLTPAALSLRTPQAQRDWVTFLADTERAFFEDSFRFLREELNVRSLLIGTQADFSSADAQAGSDVTSMHAYWAHPIFPGLPWDPDNWLVRNRSMVAARDEWHTLNRLAFHRREGKPFIVDEYNHPQPNSFGAEGFPLAAAYGALQDWDGIAGWTYREGSRTAWLSAKDWARPAIHDYFALDADPVRQLSAWLAAVIFRRGDVAPAKCCVRLTVTAEQEQAIARTVGLTRQCEVVAGGAERLPLRHRVVVGSGRLANSPPLPRPEGAAMASDTGELVWELHGAGGVVTINTPRTKAVIGIGAGVAFSLGAVTIRPGRTAQRGFGVWAITARDGDRPLETARRVVIVTCGYSQNTAQEWRLYPNDRLKAGPPPADAAVTVGSAWGGPPALAEGLPAHIILPAASDRVRVWALDAAGRRRKRVPVRSELGLAVVETDPRYRTLWYEAVVAPSGHAAPRCNP